MDEVVWAERRFSDRSEQDSKLNSECVTRVSNAVTESVRQWHASLPGRVAQAMWEGAVSGGLYGAIFGAYPLPPGFLTGVAGAVIGSITGASWTLFVYSPIEYVWHFSVTKQFNLEVRLQQECGALEKKKP